METLKRMGRKCLRKKSIVALILMMMKSSMEQEEENLKKGHFGETSINLRKSILLYHYNKKHFFKGCMEIKLREEEKFLYSLLLQIMKMVEAEVEIMFEPEDVGHEYLLLKIMKIWPITLPGRQTFEAKLMTK